MTHVTSLELSKRLAAVSGWHNTGWTWHKRLDNGKDTDKYNPFVAATPEVWKTTEWEMTPAFDSGFLLRQLPPYSQVKSLKGDVPYMASYDNGVSTRNSMADTPEDALAELCLALFEAGVLKR